MNRYRRGLLEKFVSRKKKKKNKTKLKNKNLMQCIASFKKIEDKLDDVNRCLEQKADVNTKSKGGITPLHLAVHLGLDIIVELLLNKNADVNAKDAYGWMPLHDAIYRGKKNIVALLLTKNADINATNGDGDTSLHIAACEGHEDIVKLLINENVNVDAIGEFGRTPLHVAVTNGNTNIVALLLTKNADINATDGDGDTSLHMAASEGHENIIKLLINENLNVEAKNEFGRTPLHIAAIYGNTNVVRLLLNKHANVKVIDENRYTPLHYAARKGYEDIVNLLTNENANVDARGDSGWTPLHVAVLNKNTNVVRLLISKHANVNAKDEVGDTPLHKAVYMEHEDIFKLLINENVNVDAKGEFGMTPLHVAVTNGNTNIVALLLTKNADINATDGDGDTSLHIAAREEHEDIVKLLINENVNVDAIGKFGMTPLHVAVTNGNTNIVALLLTKNADINATDGDGDTLLHMAASEGHEDIVKLLINENVNVEAKNEFGRTPLHIATIYENTNVVRLLLNKHANVKVIDENRYTPLHYAARKGHEDIINLLTNENANVDARGDSGWTPLHVAVLNKNTNVVRLLISKHANVNAKDEVEDTPLHKAVYMEHEEIFKLLINENVNVDAIGEFGWTPLHVAATYKNTNIVRLLINKNVNVNAKGEFGRTPLHVAATYGNTNIVRLLISSHADVNVKDEDGDTPLHKAVYEEHENIVKLLINENANVDVVGEFGWTPLFRAVLNRNAYIVGLLLSKYGDVNVIDGKGENDNVNLKNKKTPGMVNEEAIIKVTLLQGILDGNSQDEFSNAALHTNMEIISGVDINLQDSDGNTPLHYAAKFLFPDIAELLLRHGSDVTLKNKTGYTSLTLAQLFSFDDNADIVQILQTAEMKALDNLSHNNLHNRKIDDNTKHLKIIDDFGFSGQLYETKLISLFYLRMLISEHLEQDLLLGANIDDIGDMDDICLRYRVKDQQRPVVLFIQGKHKKSPKSKLTNKDLWSGCGDFDLRKYFKSYLKIIQQFQLNNEDPMFQGNHEDIDCYFILYTSAQDSLGTKRKTNIKINEIIHELINTSKSTEPFQYCYDDADIDNLMKAVDVYDSGLNLTTEKYTTHAKNFFSKLWIYSNQANETKVENIVKEEINKYCNNKDQNYVILEHYSDAMFLIIHTNVQKWWRSRNNAPYLTRSNDWFKLAQLSLLANVLLIICKADNFLPNDVKLQFNNFSHFTTATIEDLHIWLRELLRTISTMKLKNEEMGFNLLSLDFLKTDSRLNRETTLLDSDKSGLIHTYLNLSPEVILSDYLVKSDKFKYSKRNGTSEVGGVLLKTKMSSLIFLRALNHAQIDHNTVLLRAKIPGISMTDICLRFQLKDQEKLVMLFMQLIYRENPEKRKLTAEALWTDSENSSLLKYFLSYLEIKEQCRKSNDDDMFKGGCQNADCNFFLCTSVEESFTRNKINQHVSREIIDLINTGDNTKVFQLDHNDADIDRLIKMTAKDQLNKLGNFFLKSAFHEKFDPNLMSNELFAKYHVIMAHEVLQPCEEQPKIDQYRMWKFRSDFFDSNLEHLMILRESFFKTKTSKCHNYSNTELQSLNIKLPLTFGNLDMTFNTNENKTQRIPILAGKLMNLLALHKDTNIVEINDDDVGPDKIVQKGFLKAIGGIGSAIGNLLIFDADTKTLKFDLKRKDLPPNANLFLKELLDDKYNPLNKDLSVYRIIINVNKFPKSSSNDDENDKRQARDFFRKFWIYPIQATEDEIERIFKSEINKTVSENKSYFMIGNILDVISLLFLNRFQQWSLLPSGSSYLTRASALIELAKQECIYSLLQSVVNFMYISGNHSIDIIKHQSSSEDEQEQYEQYKKTAQLFENISSQLLSILDPQKPNPTVALTFQWHNIIRILNYKTSKLSLKIHPNMESVLLIFTAEFGDDFAYRAFACAGFVRHASGSEINRAEGKFMIYEQKFIESDLNHLNRLF